MGPFDHQNPSFFYAPYIPRKPPQIELGSKFTPELEIASKVDFLDPAPKQGSGNFGPGSKTGVRVQVWSKFQMHKIFAK